MKSRIKSYDCKRCNQILVNHSLSEINAHRVTHRMPMFEDIKIAALGDDGLNEEQSLRKKNRIKKNTPKRNGRNFRSLRGLKEKIDALTSVKKKLESDIKKINPRPSHPFYDSPAWLSLRYDALKTLGRRCAFCKTTDGVMHVDHIKHRSIWPLLELSLSNLQILCKSCNLGKSNKDDIDWR